MSSFRDLQQKAKALGIKTTGPGVTKEHLLMKIQEVEEQEIVARPRSRSSQSRRSSRGSPSAPSIRVATLDLSDNYYTAFAGRHVFLDDELKEKLEAELKDRIDPETKLAFYNDGEKLIAEPGEERMLEMYEKALKEHNIEFSFTYGVICFKTFFPLELYGILTDDLLPIGGLDFPTQISTIHEGEDDRGTGISVYTFDTYL